MNAMEVVGLYDLKIRVRGKGGFEVSSEIR